MGKFIILHRPAKVKEQKYPRTPFRAASSSYEYLFSTFLNSNIRPFLSIPSPGPLAEAERSPGNDFRQVTMTDPTAKLTPPASPTASFYDLSDDEEGEYNTIMHSSSGRGVKLLFSKSKVCATSNSSERAKTDKR